ncbi:hypothetical protein [Hyalangium gracile]|uniref:hypothetical protein n=1 Tax=Hyalangium gracile TaxID=394092 RepID=UPI001CCB5BE7|nr:hypothetical protein [Hyalangium gracile]
MHQPGLSHAFGRDGTLDRAVHKDVLERLRANCTDEEIEDFCADPTSEECLKHCGGRTSSPAQGGR